jgi:hypothetical protein
VVVWRASDGASLKRKYGMLGNGTWRRVMSERYSYPFHAPQEAVLMEEADCQRAIQQARREERERIAKYVESMDIPYDEYPYSPAAIAEDIRAMSEEEHDDRD